MTTLYRWLFLFAFLALAAQASAQTDQYYTAPNDITLTLPGTNIQYSYFSNRMVVGMNQENTKFEFRVPLSSFTPANTGSPQVLLHELLLAPSFPELIIYLDAPTDLVLSDRLQNEKRMIRGVLITQGVSRDIETELHIIPLPNQLSLSFTFSFSLAAPNVELPLTYTGMVLGMGEVLVQNARWINNQKINR